MLIDVRIYVDDTSTKIRFPFNERRNADIKNYLRGMEAVWGNSWGPNWIDGPFCWEVFHLQDDHKGGVVSDAAEAARYICLAADQGLDVALKELGAMYEEGRGVARDGGKALRLYALAAEQGLADAMFRVAVCYEQGRWVARDRRVAVRMCSLAMLSDPIHAGAADLLRELAGNIAE
jgi:hypothetical protein